MQPNADMHTLDGAQPTPKRGRCSALLQHIKNPSVSVISTSLSTIALIVAAICIAAISETLYHRTLNTFARAALNSITSRVSYSLTVSLQDRALTMDGLVLATLQMNRMVPGLEDAELSKTGIVRPLGPSVANTTTGPFIYNLGSKIPNSSLAINTWRDFYGSQLASMKLSRRLFFSDLETVFTDGAFLRMETAPKDIYSVISVPLSNAVLYDGILLANQSNGSSYYVRRTAITDGFYLSFDKSTIVAAPQMADRRQESWYKTAIPTPLFGAYGVSSMVWSNIRINATSGAAWVDLIARLDTRPSGNIGKARLSFDLNSATLSSDSYRLWMPLNGVQTYTISALANEVIITADEFRSNPMLSLHRTEVPSVYTLTASDTANGCILSPNNDNTGSLTMTCRHTVSTYGNRVLQKATEAIQGSQFKQNIENNGIYSNIPTAGTDSFGNMDTGVPYYASFECDGEKYYVSASTVRVRETAIPYTTTPPLRWVTLSIVRQSEVTAVLSDVRAIVIAVTIAIVILLSIVFAVGTRFVLGPVGEIAYLMTVSAYMRDSGSSNSFPGLSPRQVEFINKRLRDRPLSRFAEVRAIQEAYFAMSDELQELKAYIPEHLREEIMASREAKRSSTQQGAEVEVGEGTAAAVSIDIEPRELPEANRSPTSDNGDAAIPRSETEDEVIPMAHNPFSLTEEANITQVEAPPTIPEVTSPPGRVSPRPGSTPSVKDSNEKLPDLPRSESALSVGPSVKDQPVVEVKSKDLDPYHPIFFADSCLIDRDITVVHLNIIGFHHYARRRHPTSISSDYAEFITYMNTEVKRFGGVLESFFGDKLWVSFNATSKCVRHQVAACYFAFQVTQAATSASKRYRAALPGPPKDGSKPPPPVIDKRFALCAGGGINCGVSTGKGFVGPLGNSSVKRHNIISNAISEAAALERQTLQYHGCNIFVATDMLPSIEGYLQYMLVDLTPLPGSLGRRRVMANIMGVMLGPSADASVVSRWLKEAAPEPAPGLQVSDYVLMTERPLVVRGGKQPTDADCGFEERAVPTVNRFAAVNESVRAMMNGNIEATGRWLQAVRAEVQAADWRTLETDGEFSERQPLATSIVLLIETILGNNHDGRTYYSSMGETYIRSRQF